MPAGPLQHLLVAAAGQIDAAVRAALGQVVAERGRRKPPRFLLERRQEPVQPALLVDPAVRLGPETELLPVIGERDGHRFITPEPLEERDRPLHGLERQPVAQPLGRREQRDGRPGIFRRVASEQVPEGVIPHLEVGRQPRRGGGELVGVHHRVPQPGPGEGRGQVGLPHPFRQPAAGGVGAELRAQRRAHPGQLPLAVRFRQERQDRLIVAPAEQLHLPARRQRPDPLQEPGLVGAQPVQQAAAIVQREAHAGVALKRPQERLVRLGVGLLEDEPEVPDRLMAVDRHQQRHGCLHQRAAPAGAGAGPRPRPPTISWMTIFATLSGSWRT